MTSGVDQMVALHTASQDDVLLCLQEGQLCPNQDRVGELVGALVDHFTRSVSAGGGNLETLLQFGVGARARCSAGNLSANN